MKHENTKIINFSDERLKRTPLTAREQETILKVFTLLKLDYGALPFGDVNFLASIFQAGRQYLLARKGKDD